MSWDGVATELCTCCILGDSSWPLPLPRERRVDSTDGCWVLHILGCF